MYHQASLLDFWGQDASFRLKKENPKNMLKHTIAFVMTESNKALKESVSVHVIWEVRGKKRVTTVLDILENCEQTASQRIKRETYFTAFDPDSHQNFQFHILKNLFEEKNILCQKFIFRAL